MKYIIFVLMVTTISLAWAQDDSESQKRGSSLSYNIDAGQNEYINHSISANFGIDKYWAVGIGGTKSGDNTNNEYASGYVYISGQWNDFFSNKVNLKSNTEKPQELVGRGLDLQTELTYPIFNEDRYSTFSLTFGQMIFAQTVINNVKFGAARSEIEFTQKSYTLSYEQELTEFLSLGLSHTGYSYEDQSRATFTGRNGRFSVSGPIDSTSDYQDARNSIWSTLTFEKFEFDISVSKTKSKIADNDYRAIGLYFSYFLNVDWTISSGVDSIKYDTDKSKSDIYNLGVSFSF